MRFAPLLEWRLTLAANQPTCESSLGLFHPVCLLLVALIKEFVLEGFQEDRFRHKSNTVNLRLGFSVVNEFFLCYVKPNVSTATDTN
jgi:hypothetical protein